MRVLATFVSAVVATCSMTVPASAALLVNTGFEEGTDTAADGWILGSGAIRTADAANTGSYGVQVTIGSGQEQRVQQNTDPGSIVPGTSYDYTIDVRADTDLVGMDVQVWLQWYNSENTFIGQELQGLPGITTSFQTYIGSAVAPANADHAHVFLRLATGAFEGAGGMLSVDNFSVVPEPAALSLLGLGGLGLLRRRRV